MINKDFLDFSISKLGVLVDGCLGANFKLKSNIRSIFPYLNSSIADARFYDEPEHIQFYFKNIKCTLYPDELIAASFTSSKEALSFYKLLMDYIDDLYHKRESIQPDYRKYHPPSILNILKLLGKNNCRKCGYPTCMAFAVALREGETTPENCISFADPINMNKIYPIFDDKGDLVSTVAIDFDTQDKQLSVSGSNGIGQTDHVTIGINELGNEKDRNTTADFMDPPLTQREIQVLKHITRGSTNTEIAKTLHISPHTVKSHVTSIFNKLGVNDRTQAAVWATRNQLNVMG